MTAPPSSHVSATSPSVADSGIPTHWYNIVGDLEVAPPPHLHPGTREPITADTLLGWARERLAGYKRPRSVIFSDDLPKSSAGKILRRAVRDQLSPAGSDGKD